MDRIFALLSAAMFIVMLSSVALFLMIVDAGARQPVPAPSAPLVLVGSAENQMDATRIGPAAFGQHSPH